MNKSEAGKLGYLKTKEHMNLYREKNKNKAIKKWILENKKCPTCQSLISYEKRQNTFCSQSCAAKHNNNAKVLKKTKYCKNCNQPSYRNVFCKVCIENGEHLNKLKSLEKCKTDKSRKNILLKDMEIKRCEICLNSKWNNLPITLELDHIDGNHKNNLRENLRIICPNCHSQTPNYKGKNKGNGRKWRRDLYKKEMEPEIGLAPTTLTLQKSCSTN